MPPEVVAALTAAAVSLISAIVTLIVGLRSIKVEREKLQADRDRLQIETERLQSEIEKLEAETEKLRAESDDVRRERLELEQTRLEIEKQKALSLLDRRKDVYPELLELVYRLRNRLREILESYDEAEQQTDSWYVGGGEIGEELYLLTENLYKYRAFIDEDSFQMVHRYKRILQDAKVLLNRITRPFDEEKGEDEDFDEWASRRNQAEITRYKESAEELKKMYNEIDKLYSSINSSIKEHIGAILER